MDPNILRMFDIPNIQSVDVTSGISRPPLSHALYPPLIELELKVARLRAMGSWPEGGEGKVAQAAQRYRAHLKSNNLVDR